MTPGAGRFSWAVLPAALFLTLLPVNHTMAMRLLCLFLAALAAARHFLGGGTPALAPPLKLALALWAGLASLSLLWSANPLFSLNEVKSEIGYGMLAFLSFFVLTRGETEWRLWRYCLAAGTLASAALMIGSNRAHLGNFHAYDWNWVHGFVPYSTYLALVFPFLLSLWIATPLRDFPRNLLWLLPLPFLFAGYATLNRMFWLSLGATLLVYALLWRRGGADAGRRRHAFLATGAALALVALLFVTVAMQRPPQANAPPSGGLDAYTHIASTFSDSERYRIWDFWLARGAEHPWRGIGFGRDLPAQVHAGMKPADWTLPMFSHAHNLFINYFVQLGAGGLFVLSLLLGALLREFWKVYRLPGGKGALAGICGIALVLTLIGKNLTDDLFWRNDALLFWALAGMTLGYGKCLEETS